MGTQVLTDAQNAIAGWRRVIGILDTPADLDDPGPSGSSLPRGAMDVAFEDVSFGYPGGPLVLRDVDRAPRVRQPGRGGRRDRLGQDHLRQAAHPADGPHRRARCCSTASTSATVEFASLRRRVVLVPQEGFLFDSTLLDNVRYGDLDATREQVRRRRRRARPRRLARRACRTASTPASASAASRSRPASASWSRCCAPTSPTPTCSSSTRPPAPSTPRWRCASAGRWSG